MLADCSCDYSCVDFGAVYRMFYELSWYVLDIADLPLRMGRNSIYLLLTCPTHCCLESVRLDCDSVLNINSCTCIPARVLGAAYVEQQCASFLALSYTGINCFIVLAFVSSQFIRIQKSFAAMSNCFSFWTHAQSFILVVSSGASENRLLYLYLVIECPWNQFMLAAYSSWILRICQGFLFFLAPVTFRYAFGGSCWLVFIYLDASVFCYGRQQSDSHSWLFSDRIGGWVHFGTHLQETRCGAWWNTQAGIRIVPLVETKWQ